MRDPEHRELIETLRCETAPDQAGTPTDPTPDVSVVVVAALLAASSEDLLVDALRMSTSTADRQFVAIAAAYLAGDHDRVRALASDHLLDHSSRPVLAWMVAQSRSVAPNRGEHP